MKRLLLLLLITPVLITGCNQISDKDKVEMTAEITQRPIVRVDAEDKTAQAPKIIEFEKLSLAQAFEIAEQSHPALAWALSKIEQGKGDLLQAGLHPNPEVIARMESAPLSSNTADHTELIAGVSQNIPLGKRLDAAVDVAKKQQDQLSIAMQLQRMEIHVKVQLAYAEVWYWSKAVNLWSQVQDDAQKNYSFAKARLDAGDTIATEVSRAKIELQRMELKLGKATSLKNQAMVALRVAIGIPDAKIAALDDLQQLVSVETPDIDAMVDKLDQNLLIIASRAEINTRQAQTKLAKERRKPDLGINVAYRRLNDRDSAFDLGFGLPIPLFDHNQGNILKSKAALTSARIKAKLIHNELEKKLRELHSTHVRAVNSAELLRDGILPQSQKVLKEMELRYKAGDSSMAEILIVRRDSIANQIDYLESLRDILIADAELIPFKK